MKNLLLLLTLICAVSLTSCDVMDVATPQEVEVIQEQDARIEKLEDAIETAGSKWLGAIAEIKAIGTQFDEMERADFDKALAFAMSVASDAQAEYENAASLWELETGAQDKLVGELVARSTSPLIPFLPVGWPQLIPLGIPFLFDRPRRHLGKTASHALKLDLANVVKSIAKLSGFLDSDNDERPSEGRGEEYPG